MRKKTKMIMIRKKKREKALRKMRLYKENYPKYKKVKKMYLQTLNPGHMHTKSNF